MEAAKRLRDVAGVRVTVVDRQNHHLFQPLLYQVATAGLSAPEIAQPVRGILAKHENTQVVMDEVASIDLKGKTVTLGSAGELAFDYLIIALGVVTGYFGRHDWARHAKGLKSLDDATAIRRDLLLAFEHAETCEDPAEIERLMTVVVVGGGPTGVEMAGAIAELAKKVLYGNFRKIDPSRARIILVEAAPKVLGMFPDDLPSYTVERLEKMGVTVRTGCAVDELGAGFAVVAGEKIEAANIIWAAGVDANPLTRSLGVDLDRSGRIKVRADLSVPGYREVFAVGDIAHLVDRNEVKVPGVCPAAIQMGAHAAKVIANEIELQRAGRRDIEELVRPGFVYWDKGMMATIGRSAAVAESNGMKFKGFVAWLMWLFVHLLFLIGFRNKVAVVIQWIYAYVRYRRGARIITGIDDVGTPAQPPGNPG